MRFWPDSLFGRLLIAVTVPIAIVLVISLILIVQDRAELTRRVGGTGDTLQRIVAVVSRLEALEPSARLSAILELDRRPAAWRLPGRMPAPILDPPELAAHTGPRAFAEPLLRLLGPDWRVIAEPARRIPSEPLIDWGLQRAVPPLPVAYEPLGPNEATSSSVAAPGVLGRFFLPQRAEAPAERGLYDISLTAPGGARYHFRVPGPPRETPLDTRFAVELLLLTLALAFALFFATRHLTRPLHDLQRAAASVERAASRAAIPERGAREIRDTIHAFNTMQERLHRYLDGRTRVLAAMSHDLRTPLTRLRLRAEAIDDDAARAKFAADIEEMDSLVSSALGLFRGLDEHETAVPVDVDAMLELLRADFRMLGHEIQIEGRAQTPVLAQPLGLRRALTNLIDNAIKFGGPASLQVETDPGHSQLRIHVLDRGPGILETELEAVFEPFHRLENSRNRALGGTGLGLCSARDAIEKQGGTLRLRNRSDGPGLEATIELPREKGTDLFSKGK